VVYKKSTILNYSHQLTCLDQLVCNVNYDITEFNNEVQKIVYLLQSRGESIQHLMVNLFKRYQVTADKELVSYIHLKNY